MTSEEKQIIVSLLRKETGMGCLGLSKALNTFIEALNRRPEQHCDVGLRMKIEWERYSLR